jgi:hypothetical protein
MPGMIWTRPTAVLAALLVTAGCGTAAPSAPRATPTAAAPTPSVSWKPNRDAVLCEKAGGTPDGVSVDGMIALGAEVAADATDENLREAGVELREQAKFAKSRPGDDDQATQAANDLRKLRLTCVDVLGPGGF